MTGEITRLLLLLRLTPYVPGGPVYRSLAWEYGGGIDTMILGTTQLAGPRQRLPLSHHLLYICRRAEIGHKGAQ